MECQPQLLLVYFEMRFSKVLSNCLLLLLSLAAGECLYPIRYILGYTLKSLQLALPILDTCSTHVAIGMRRNALSRPWSRCYAPRSMHWSQLCESS